MGRRKTAPPEPGLYGGLRPRQVHAGVGDREARALVVPVGDAARTDGGEGQVGPEGAGAVEARPDELGLDAAAPARGQGRVGMQDGHVNFAGSGGFIDLGPGEAGYLGEGQNVPIRLRQYPAFLLTDPYPRPDKFDEQTLRLLDVLNPGGGPGNVICEM